MERSRKTKTPKNAKTPKAQIPVQIPKEVEEKYEYFFVVKKAGVFYLGVGYRNRQYYVIDLFHGFYEVPVSDSVAEELLAKEEDIVYARGPYDDYFYDPREDFE